MIVQELIVHDNTVACTDHLTPPTHPATFFHHVSYVKEYPSGGLFWSHIFCTGMLGPVTNMSDLRRGEVKHLRTAGTKA